MSEPVAEQKPLSEHEPILEDGANLEEGHEPPRRAAPLVLVPLLLFLPFAGLLLMRLFAGDASRLPSALIGKQAPTFALAPVNGLDRPGLATADLRKGGVTLLNVFASWCVPCREEAPALLLLSQSGVRIVGIAYKDAPENTRRYLGQEGDPYQAIGVDESGRTAIDFGVYGVPETYVVKGDGTIADKFVGPLSEESIRNELMPAIAKAKG